MVPSSLVLILVAVVSLGLGLTRGSNAFLVGSIAASVLAAIVLIIGARRNAARRTALADEEPEISRGPGDEVRADDGSAELNRQAARRREQVGVLHGGGAATTRASARNADTMVLDNLDRTVVGASVPTVSDVELDEDVDDLDDDDPPDEPAAQVVAAGDAARLAQLAAEVLVIDGRPRYHKPGCVHLLGRESEPLSVSEAIELGFTPCSLCEPATSLLADARRA